VTELTASSRYTAETAEQALARALATAELLSLPVTSWIEGEPTLTLVEYHALRDSQLQAVILPILAGGLLEWASGDWLTLLARNVYNVERIGKTFASVTITASCTPGKGPYNVEAGDVVVRNSTTGKTYTSVSPLVGNDTIQEFVPLSIDVVADEAGSESSASAGEIDELVTNFIGVTVTNATAAVGLDEESDDALRARCRLKRPAVSKIASGPKGKYAYVALSPDENGGANVTRVEVRGDTSLGTVDVVIGGPSGQVTVEDAALVEAALVQKVIGPVETLDVIRGPSSATNVVYTLWVYSDVNLDEATIKAQVEQRLTALFQLAPIGGWSKTGVPGEGYVWRSLIEATIKGTSSRIFEVDVATPSGDVAHSQNTVLVLGTCTGTVNFVAPPQSGGT